jgi:hypothetical protein
MRKGSVRNKLGVMLSRRSAKRASARRAKDGRSIPLLKHGGSEQGDPSTVLRAPALSRSRASAAQDDNVWTTPNTNAKVAS